MKKLFPLALIAVCTLFSPSANSQSILLINGKAAKVTLTGDQINSIVQQQIDDYMKAFDQAPVDDFSKAELRTNNKENQEGRLIDFQAATGLSDQDISFLRSDRPHADLKKE